MGSKIESPGDSETCLHTLQENRAFPTAKMGRKWLNSVGFEVISDRVPTDGVGHLKTGRK